MTPAVAATDLYRFYHAGDEETLALRGVSISLSPGEVVAVTGPSGSGKSTLLRCLAGLDEPDGGRVTVGGERVTRRPEAERAALRLRAIGILRQSGNLIGHLTVAQNVALVQSLAGRRDAGRVRSLLGELSLAHRRDAAPATLSGGEASRAGLAVALANDPAVLLADEPTGELDAASADRLVELLRRRAERGAAILLATHDEAVAARADRTVAMSGGLLLPA